MGNKFSQWKWDLKVVMTEGAQLQGTNYFNCTWDKYPLGERALQFLDKMSMNNVLSQPLEHIYLSICTGPCAGGLRWDQRVLKQFVVFSTLVLRLRRSARFRYIDIVARLQFWQFCFFSSPNWLFQGPNWLSWEVDHISIQTHCT